MKKFIFLTLLLSCATAFSQGTISFQSRLDGDHAIPPSPRNRNDFGEFFLDDLNRFGGYVEISGFGVGARITSVRIYETLDPSLLGSARFDFSLGEARAPFPPDDPGAQYYNLGTEISADDRASLLAGNWYINVATLEFPTGEMRGQIIAIPEPGSLELCLIGAGFLLLMYRRRRFAFR